MGNNDYGVRRFFERAEKVLSKLDDATKDLIMSLIDPNSTVQPQSRCKSFKPAAASPAQPTSVPGSSTQTASKPAKVAV